jgi:hypothetical protein
MLVTGEGGNTAIGSQMASDICGMHAACQKHRCQVLGKRKRIARPPVSARARQAERKGGEPTHSCALVWKRLLANDRNTMQATFAQVSKHSPERNGDHSHKQSYYNNKSRQH